MLHDKRNKKSLSPEVFRFMGLDDYGLPRYQRWNSLWNVWIYTSMVPTKRISKVLTYEDTWCEPYDGMNNEIEEDEKKEKFMKDLNTISIKGEL